MTKNHKKTILIMVLPIALFLTSQKAMAVSSDMRVRAIVPASISLVLSTNSINFNIDAPLLLTDTMTLTAKTNSLAGYTISFNANNDYTGLKYESETIESDIPSISTTTNAANFPATGWAYSLEAEDFVFKQIPLEAKNIYATTSEGENEHIFTTGVRATNVASGKYSNELIFTATVNPVSNTISDLVSLQEMTGEVCDASYPAEKKQLTDVRDGKSYWVEKLEDGNCWMTQNLDLDLDATTTLIPATSDVNENWTPLRSTIKGVANLDSTTWQNDSNSPYSFDPGNYYIKGGYRSAATNCNYTEMNCENFQTSPYSENGEHGHVGNYYNFSAAVAMNDTSDMTTIGMNIESSICPAGWRLPYGYQSAEGGDYVGLVNAYNENELNEKLVTAPNYFIYSGLVSGGRLAYGDYSGNYLTSTIASNQDADGMFVAPNNSISTTANGRYYGQSIRCIARKTPKNTTPESPKMLSMQKVSEWKDTLSTDQSIQVKDDRDDKIYWVTKLKDGNIWMTQNLDYDLSDSANRTLRPETSDVITAKSLAVESTWGEDNDKIYYKDGGDIYYVDGRELTATYSTLSADSENRHYHVGDYYSWGAATAGQASTIVYADEETTESICPAGWRLPTMSDWDADEPYSFANMIKNYYYLDMSYYMIGNDDDETILKSAPYFIHGGLIWYSGSDAVPDFNFDEGDYWTSKSYNGSYGKEAYALTIATTNVYAGGSVYYEYWHGLNLRCIAK